MAVSRRFVTLTALLVVVVAVIAACGSDASDDVAATGDPSDTTDSTTTTAPGGVATGVEGPEWVFDAADSSIDVPDDATITLGVADGLVSGMAACNTYRGSFEVDGTTVTVGQLVSTERGCEQPLMDAEAAYTSALQSVETAEVTDTTLVLTGPESTRLSFTALDREEALIGTWDVIQLATTDAVTGVLDGTEPTVEFLDDGTLSANTGCNNGGSSWELDGAQLTIGPIASTQMACEDPAGIMDQEADLFAALEASKQIDITGDTLMLLREDGTITLVATAPG